MIGGCGLVERRPRPGRFAIRDVSSCATSSCNRLRASRPDQDECSSSSTRCPAKPPLARASGRATVC